MSSRNTKNFDYKDLQIVSAIDRLFNKHKYKISTEKISEVVNIPARSIRYRLSKLKEKGLLRQKIPITHERRLGIGEKFIILSDTS